MLGYWNIALKTPNVTVMVALEAKLCDHSSY